MGAPDMIFGNNWTPDFEKSDLQWGMSDAVDKRLLPFGMVSLLDMLNLEPNSFLAPFSFIGGTVSEWRLLQQLEGRIAPHIYSLEQRSGFLRSVDLLKGVAASLSMTTSVAIIENGYEGAISVLALQRPWNSLEIQKLIVFGEMVLNVFLNEANARAFIALAPGHARFLSAETPLFGSDVDDAFPAAGFEIADAGRCRAAGLWTACVVHLMRATEEPLNALARWAGVEVNQNWNTALNQIDARLKDRSRSQYGAAEEQWAAEASAHLRAIKNAWRNHAAHGRTRYNEEEAVAIWNNVEALMKTLARKLGE